MAIVRLLDEDDVGPETRALYARMKQLMKIQTINAFNKSLGHSPANLAASTDEANYVLGDQALSRKTKEYLAVAVSMLHGCPYCINSHATVLRKFRVPEAAFVELASVVGHVTGLNAFAVMEPDAPPGQLPAPLAQEIRGVWGTVPPAYLAMAEDPECARLIWNREKAAMADGAVEGRIKRLVGYTLTALTGPDSARRLAREAARAAGWGDKELFEARTVAHLFARSARYAIGLQLEPDLLPGQVKTE